MLSKPKTNRLYLAKSTNKYNISYKYKYNVYMIQKKTTMMPSLVRILTIRTWPSAPGCTSRILPSFQSKRGAFSSLTITKVSSCSSETYSLFHRAQNCCWIFWLYWYLEGLFLFISVTFVSRIDINGLLVQKCKGVRAHWDQRKRN